MAGRLKATLTLPGEDPKELGISQVASYLSNPEESIRKAAYEACAEAWRSEETMCSLALNNITETRRKRNARLGVDDLEHTLEKIDSTEPPWMPCGPHATLLGRHCCGTSTEKINFSGTRRSIRGMFEHLQPSRRPTANVEQACTDIIDAFNGFDPDMGTFATRALQEGWVDATPGPNRRMGGFCTTMADIEESRIFMTFSGTLRSAMTLAHELGHAYHNDVLFEHPPSMRTIMSSTAESASTFAEALFFVITCLKRRIRML